MPPRKSTARNTRPSHAPRPSGPSAVASSSKLTLDVLPPPDMPESLTPDYIGGPVERVQLDEEDRERLIHELVGFDARILVNEITEQAREVLTTHVNGIEAWALEMARKTKDPRVEREVKIGMHAFETLLESHVDKAFDKFAAWALRNAFEIPPDAQVVLPWHQSLDFPRAAHITSDPSGPEELETTIDELRSRVEQARLLSLRLAQAEKLVDRRLEIARQRKKEVGFVKEVLDTSGLTPLPPKTQQVHSSLTALHTTLSSLDPNTPLPRSAASTHPSAAGSFSAAGQGAAGKEGAQKAWEMGRQAYLHWAVDKMVQRYGAEGAPRSLSGGVGGADIPGNGRGTGARAAGQEGEADKVAQVEKMMRDAQGGPEDVERMVRSAQ